ncbi:hypothetical protein FOQG_15978 [Fusarium oxysporum f. sp. raphani 54005]|uniref:Uncharacterized protein n=1 Tax=Fusarium oxysporum f. sp. raphani 54005 TaxID=1089458 RepID=X0BCA7_FUSOX|nr:hypothetical protein FOQG_15978 [Fusarium oxysporum f. sp. raphani 54005]
MECSIKQCLVESIYEKLADRRDVDEGSPKIYFIGRGADKETREYRPQLKALIIATLTINLRRSLASCCESLRMNGEADPGWR